MNRSSMAMVLTVVGVLLLALAGAILGGLIAGPWLAVVGGAVPLGAAACFYGYVLGVEVSVE